MSAIRPNRLRVAAVAVLTPALLCAAGLALYHWTLSRPALPKFAVVDVAEIYRLKEAQFGKVIGDPRATDAERAKALDDAQRFARDLVALVQSLPLQCQCVVLNKAAVVGSATALDDLTPIAKRAVGL